jgi:uncharacterized protein (TIGR03067 family)
VTSNLPPRPNLEHLRRQAKALLASLTAGDAQAVRTLQQHLPAAKNMTEPQVRAAGFRLADAQSAVARATGFASWPCLARHVEQLRSLEGAWSFESLEIEGNHIPAEGLRGSRLLIDGDRFRMESPEANYEGVFNINVEADPHEIDIEFVEGPEAGNWNYGIFRLGTDRLEICLDMHAKPRPKAFATAPGSGQAYEVLRRTSGARPEAVSGGRRDASPRSAAATGGADPAAYAPIPSVTLGKLQGDWSAESIVRDGTTLPAFMLKSARRTMRDNEITVVVGGMVMIHALVRIDESRRPMHVDYLNIGGVAKGTVQLGIMEWRQNAVCFCTAEPAAPRPTDFSSPTGSGQTLSIWRFGP